jgi:HlyD family secretion protein
VRRATLVLFTLVAGALSLTAAACEPSDDGISIGDVRRGTVIEVVDVPASVTAKAVATLTAAADGTLRTLAVEPGDAVAKGAVVAVIDSPNARKRLADAKAALRAASGFGGGASVNLGGLQRGLDAAAADAFEAAQSAAEQIADEKLQAALVARLEASRAHYAAASKTSKRLLAQVQRGLTSISDAVAALGAAQRIQAQATFDIAKATVDALTLRAPIAGVVQYARPSAGTSADPLAGLLGAVSGTASGDVPVAPVGADQNVAGVDDMLAPGDQVATGAAIVTIVDISEIGLAGEVDETDVLLVAPGVLADVELDAAPGVIYEATVRSVDLLPTPSNRGGVAYRLRLSLNAPTNTGVAAPPTPRPGMSAVAHLRVRTAAAAVAVPAAAVFTTELGETLWVVRDGHAVRQQVKLGVQGEDLVEIRDGVEPGQRVVVSGADKVVADQELS